MINNEIERFVDDIYPVTIIYDRYSGCYSGAKFTAWLLDHDEIPEDAQGGDTDCSDFWWYDSADYLIGKGNTVQEAYDNLIRKVKKLAIEMEQGLYNDTEYRRLTYLSDDENIKNIIRQFNYKEKNNNAT